MSHKLPWDVGSLRLTNETSAEQFHRFIGALQAARALGLNVRLRIVDDPYAGDRGQTMPLDVYAEAFEESEVPSDA
jgi:hypothetical protein